MSDFNIELSSLDETKVSTMISQRYFEFDVDRYSELSENHPALCVDFIIHNQSEYMSIYDQIAMDSTLLETLVFDQRFERSNVKQLIDDYGTEHMTTKIARNINALRINVNIDLFNAAWKLLDMKKEVNYINLCDVNGF